MAVMKREMGLLVFYRVAVTRCVEWLSPNVILAATYRALPSS